MASHDTAKGGGEAELRALRDELRALRAEQQEMAQAINQLVATFRMIATHLGIAAEPYGRGEARKSGNEPPGFA